jgi:hypothetical protein
MSAENTLPLKVLIRKTIFTLAHFYSEILLHIYVLNIY